MPGMSGLELLERVKTLYPEVDVMLLTAYGTIQNAVHAMRHGAVDYVTKPFDLRELEEKVARCFELRAQRSAPAASPLDPLIDLERVLSSGLGLAETLDAALGILQRVFAPGAIEMAILTPSDEVVVASAGDPLPCDLTPRPTRESIRAIARSVEPWILGPSGGRGPKAPNTAGSILTVPLLHGGEVVGKLTLARGAGGDAFSRCEAQLLHVFGMQVALSLLHARARQQVLDSMRDQAQPTEETIRTLVEALGMFDSSTQAHSRRVSRFGRRLAHEIGLDGQLVETVSVGGLLHDIGKLGVGDLALHKAGSLTEDESRRFRQHPVNGARILAGVAALADVVPLVRHHHEAIDGHGYPDGLVGDEIPLGARLLAVVDAFDSMVSDRPYRSALGIAEAVRRLRDAAGTRLDVALTDAWVGLVASDSMDIVPAAVADA
jgi:putative nucleotidyltransferase with HDIG domain